MKYADLITRSKEQADNALATPRANEQKARLGLEIGQLDLEVQQSTNELESLKSQYPLPVEEILEAGDALALSNRRLAQLKALSDELFGS